MLIRLAIDSTLAESPIIYDPNAETLTMTFKQTGRTIEYQDVTAEEWDDIQQTPSFGKYWHAVIKGKQFRRIN